MKPKKLATLIIAKRKPSGAVEHSHEEGEQPSKYVDKAETMIRAIHSKDAKQLAEVIQGLVSSEESNEE